MNKSSISELINFEEYCKKFENINMNAFCFLLPGEISDLKDRYRKHCINLNKG